MAGTISLVTSEISVLETEGIARIPVARDGDLSAWASIVFGVTADTAQPGADFTPTDGTLSFAPGQDRVTITVPILDDGAVEPTEAFVVSLINVEGGFLGAPRTARVNILDDENPADDPPSPPLVSDFDVEEIPVIFGRPDPIDIEFGPNGEVFVAYKWGLVSVYNADGTKISDFVQLAESVNTRQDRGLLDIALDPNFPNSPFVYAFYVVDPPEAASLGGNAGRDGGGNRYAHVVRFEADVATGFTTAVPGSQTILVGGAGRDYSDVSGGGAVDSTNPSTVDVPASDRIADDPGDVVVGGFTQDYLKVDSRSHAGGALAFGPDGALYISTGDGTSFNFADPRTFDVQSLESLSGKILRVDPATGLGLPDNPFAEPGDDLSLNKAKVFQLGLRNPFSMGFDADGRLFITDTGWNTFEEVNQGPPGANFGWPYYEGGDLGVSLPTNGYRNFAEAQAFYAALLAGDASVTAAFRAFDHRSAEPGFQVQAITGGNVVYDGDLYPQVLRGDYVFSDVSQGEIFTVDVNDRQQVKFLYERPEGFAPVHFTQGPDGAIWYADIVKDEVGRLAITDPDADTDTDRFVFRLYDAVADTILDGDLSDGVAPLGARFFQPGQLNIEALALDPGVTPPVTMELTGPNDSFSGVQNVAPYALFGNSGPDFDEGTIPAGDWRLSATANGRTQTAEFTLEAIPSQSGAIGEAGRLTLSTPDRDAWTRVTFETPIEDAIVVAGPPTFAGGQPTTIRIRNVTDDGFEVQLQEWAYLDGFHVDEEIAWLAIEAGTHVLEGGLTISAGVAQSTDAAGLVDPGAAFEDAPLVFAQIAGTAEDQPVAPRVYDVSANRFTLELDEEEAADGAHAAEAVHWIAVDAGQAQGVLAGSTGDRVTQRTADIDFGGSISDAAFIAGMQTRDGPDPATLRVRGQQEGGAQVFVEEEASRDSETNHTTEDVGWMAVASGPIFGTDFV